MPKLTLVASQAKTGPADLVALLTASHSLLDKIFTFDGEDETQRREVSEKIEKALTDPHFETRQLLNDLLEWAARMGGFDSPVWMRARVFRDRLLPEG